MTTQVTKTETRHVIQHRSSLRVGIPSDWCKLLNITAKDIMVMKLRNSRISLEKLTQ